MNKIEEMKEFFNECITKDLINSEDLALNYMKVAKDYIEELESKEQKLIEKLEEDIEIFDKENADGSLQSYAKEILEILKGEKE